MGGLIHRRIRDHDVIVGNAAFGEKIDILLRRVSGIADRQSAYANVARYKHASSPFGRGVGAGTLKRPAVNVVNMRRPIQADRNRNVASLETVQPFIINQYAIGGHRDGYVATRSR